MAGWLTRKFSTILKGPYWLYWKERSEGRKIVKMAIILRRLVLESIPEEVRKKHNIDRALKDQDKVEKEAETIDDKGFRLGFNVQLDEERAFGILQKIEQAFMNARRKHKSLGRELNQIEAEFQRELERALQEAEDETKEVYWRQLEPVIKVAEKKGKHTAIMAEALQMFKTKEDVSSLAIIAFRWEARGLRKAVTNLERDERQIESVLSKLDQKGTKPERVAWALRACVKRVTEHAKAELKNAYVLWKRDFILNLVMLRLMDSEEGQMEQFIQDHLMPKAPEIKNIQDLEVIKGKIAHNMHVLAQGFRRLIGEERVLLTLVRQEENVLKRAA